LFFEGPGKEIHRTISVEEHEETIREGTNGMMEEKDEGNLYELRDHL
jgi:hypothetical protein